MQTRLTGAFSKLTRAPGEENAASHLTFKYHSFNNSFLNNIIVGLLTKLNTHVPAFMKFLLGISQGFALTFCPATS